MTNGRIYRGKYPSKKQVEASIEMLTSSIMIDLNGFYPNASRPLAEQNEAVLFCMAVWGEGFEHPGYIRKMIAETLINRWSSGDLRYGQSIKDIILRSEGLYEYEIKSFRRGILTRSKLLKPDKISWYITASIALPIYIQPPCLHEDSPFYYFDKEDFPNEPPAGLRRVYEGERLCFYAVSDKEGLTMNGLMEPSSVTVPLL